LTSVANLLTIRLKVACRPIAAGRNRPLWGNANFGYHDWPFQLIVTNAASRCGVEK
jgi:hypothetical protein